MLRDVMDIMISGGRLRVAGSGERDNRWACRLVQATIYKLTAQE